jgi:hypothetical protein
VQSARETPHVEMKKRAKMIRGPHGVKNVQTDANSR